MGKNDKKTFKNEKSPETRLLVYSCIECTFRPTFARQKKVSIEKSIKKSNLKFIKFFKNLRFFVKIYDFFTEK
jgi:hypothetical protein